MTIDRHYVVENKTLSTTKHLENEFIPAADNSTLGRSFQMPKHHRTLQKLKPGHPVFIFLIKSREDSRMYSDLPFPIKTSDVFKIIRKRTKIFPGKQNIMYSSKTAPSWKMETDFPTVCSHNLENRTKRNHRRKSLHFQPVSWKRCLRSYLKYSLIVSPHITYL